MTARPLYFALPLTLMFACTSQPGDPNDDNPIDDEEEEIEVQFSIDAAEGIEATADIAIISGMFAGPASADDSIDAVVRSVEATAGDNCTTIDTDLVTFLEVTFDNCTVGTILVDGILRAEITRSNTTTTYALSATNLSIGGTTTNGTWTVTPDIAAGTATLAGDLDFVGPRGNSVTAAADAVIDVPNRCVDYSIAGALSFEGHTAALDANNVTRCMGVCPAAGDVSLSVETAAGHTGSLSWSYDGTGSVTVTTGRGATFPVSLPCSN